LKRTDTYWPGRDRKYADLSEDQIPLTESLKDCMERTQPIWEDRIQRELKRGRNVMVVGHANTLRGLVKTIDDIDDDDISGKLEIDETIMFDLRKATNPTANLIQTLHYPLAFLSFTNSTRICAPLHPTVHLKFIPLVCFWRSPASSRKH
jgi:bisphosphoglycerate-dependent phosphoglycerate mutase family 1